MNKDGNGGGKDQDSKFSPAGLLGRMFPCLQWVVDSIDSFFPHTLSKFFGHDSTSLIGHDNKNNNNDSPQHKTSSSSKGPIIEEVGSDDDIEQVFEDRMRHDHNYDDDNRNPIVEFPEDQDDEDEEKSKSNTRDLKYSTNRNKEEKQSQNVSFKRVTYGGIDGAYYSETTSHVSNNGMTLEETKKANRSTGEATHKISRGIDDKGHSVFRRLDSDGKVNTTQILHNLNEDDVTGFEKLWKVDADRHLQGWQDKLGSSGKAKAYLTFFWQS